MKKLSIKGIWKFSLILSVIFSFSSLCEAQLTGTVVDENNEPIPFAAVFYKETTIGTFTNEDGFYKLNYTQGNNVVVFKSIGYKSEEVTINWKNRNATQNVILKNKDYTLEAVTVYADAEDPAYPIIRKAIKARRNFKDKPENYKSRVYQKLKIELEKLPDKIMGMSIKNEQNKEQIAEILDTNKNVLVMSEVVSDFYRGSDNDWKESIISSKISGDKQGYSSMSSYFSNLDFYDDYIYIGRKIASPISSSAFLFYKFKLIATFNDNFGNKVYNIEVIPKNKYGASFSGNILITDKIWNIYEIDVNISSKNTNIRLLDSIKIKQEYIQLDSNKLNWGLLSQISDFKINILGIKAKGYHYKNVLDYKLNQSYDENFFGKIQIDVEENSNKRDSLYWDTIRPLSLSVKEKNTYVRMDSIEEVHTSKKYLDSIDRAGNKFSYMDLLTGYKYTNSYKKYHWKVNLPLLNIQFNPIQGFNSKLGIAYHKKLERNRYFNIASSVEYGLTDKQILPELKIKWLLDSKYKFLVEFKVGRKYAQQFYRNPVNEMFNSTTSLFFAKNYLKLYDKKYIKLYINKNFDYGIKTYFVAEYANRNTLKNNCDYRLYGDREYAPNIFEDGQKLVYKNKLRMLLAVSYRPGVRYVNMPNELFEMYDNHYPTFQIVYEKAIKVNNDYVDYDNIKGVVVGQLPTGILGTTNYFWEMGMFLSKKNVDILDDDYISGNQMYVMSPNSFDRNFHLLPFYTNMNFEPYFKFMVKQRLQGLLLSKIPLIKQLKMEESLTFNMYKTKNESPYYEFGFGINKLFGVVKMRYSVALKGKDYYDQGIRFSFSMPFGISFE